MSTFRFSHYRLEAFHVAKEAFVRGTAIANALPPGYSKLADQTRRALLGAYLQSTEGAAREGKDRRQRFRVARAECNEAAAAIEGAMVIGLADEAEALAVLGLLDRLAAMLTRLGGFGPSA
jgi:four helix bundle protein